jgi:hypothetical protein
MAGCAECRWTSQRYVTNLGCRDCSYVLTDKDRAEQIKVQADKDAKAKATHKLLWHTSWY